MCVLKSCGLCRSDVVWQFLTYAIVHTGAGGVIGVVLGIGISLLLNAFLPRLPSTVPLWAVAVAVIGSMSLGLFFGMYPGGKAANPEPVAALRYQLLGVGHRWEGAGLR